MHTTIYVAIFAAPCIIQQCECSCLMAHQHIKDYLVPL